MTSPTRIAPALLAAAVASASSGALLADAIVSKDAGGTIRVTPYPVSSAFQNSAWTTPQQDAFWARQTLFIDTIGAAGISSNRYFENEKQSYGRAMFNYLWASSNNNTSTMNTARNFLVATPIDGEDGGSISGMQNTDEVDLFPSFTIKWQMPKYFFFGKHTASVLGTTSGYLHHIYPVGSTGYNADKVGTAYLDRMVGAFDLWTDDAWVQPNVAVVTGGYRPENNGRAYPDPLGRPNRYYGNVVDPNQYTVQYRNSWVDNRNTDNLKAMREMAVYLAAIESGNTGNRDRYAAKIQQHVTTQYRTGQSEWDSQNYFSHGVTPMLSLYDYAPENVDGGKVKKLAKASIDFQLASAATKYYRGVIAGPSKRSNGNANVVMQNDASALGWQYFGDTPSNPAISTGWYANLQPILSAYRPPQAIVALATKSSGSLAGVELKNTKPSYANWADPGAPNELAAPRNFETIYYGQRYQMGSVVSNSSEGDLDPFAIVFNNSTRGADVFDVGSGSGGLLTKRSKDQIAQYRNMSIWLRPNGVESIASMQIQAPASAALEQTAGVWFFKNQDDNTFLAIRPINMTYGTSAAGTGVYINEKYHTANQVGGSAYFGLAMEVGEIGAGPGQFASYTAFKNAILAASLDLSAIASGQVNLTGADGRTVAMHYNTANDLPMIYRNGSLYDFSNPDNYNLFKSVNNAPTVAIANGGHAFPGTVVLAANAGDTGNRGPLNLGWKNGAMSVLAGGYLFEQTVDAAGNVSWIDRPAVADDYLGKVKRVAFFVNGSLVGEDASLNDGATLNWNPASSGEYFITAKAIDNDGETAWSSVHSLIVAIPGDADFSGTVDVTDLGALATSWQLGNQTWQNGDFTRDGVVDVSDLGMLATYWQVSANNLSLAEALSLFPALSGAAVPEPASLSLLTLAAAALLRRRR